MGHRARRSTPKSVSSTREFPSQSTVSRLRCRRVSTSSSFDLVEWHDDRARRHDAGPATVRNRGQIARAYGGIVNVSARAPAEFVLGRLKTRSIDAKLHARS